MGESTKAADEFRTAIRLEPYLTGPRAELATHARPGKAAAPTRSASCVPKKPTLLDRDAKLLPDSPDIFYRLGLLRYLLGEYKAAATALG